MAISKIIADSITDEAVTSAKIAQGTVVAADVADGTITNAKIDSVANTKITGVITTAQLAATTGTGSVVLATSPTLIAPALGTPSALVGTNISGTGASFTAGAVTTNANLTGQVTSVGNAAVLGSFTSAQLAAALTDETGSGLAVFATSPNLITPILGTPTSGNLTNCTGFPTATSAEIKTVTVSTKFIAPDALLAAQGFTARYASGNQTITNAGSLTLAHGLGRIPMAINLWLVCLTAECAYSIGDKVHVVNVHATSTTDNQGVGIVVDATNLNIRFGNSGACFGPLINFTTGVGCAFTNANWAVVVEAFA